MLFVKTYLWNRELGETDCDPLIRGEWLPGLESNQRPTD